ncbi:MAG: hypothetical protein JW981_09730 [Anaerolineae bacterium]|nr:hypothetical protein [Anaerolineae bacterium]
MSYTTQCTYFALAGAENTQETLKLASARVRDLGIKTVLVASNSGQTALKAAEVMPDIRIIDITHSTGFREPYKQELSSEQRAKLEAAGIHILTTTHAFGGVGRAVRKKLGTYQVDEIVAHTLKLFGQGMKVAVEITLMATDAGLVDGADPVMAIGGTGRGADTAVALIPTHAQTLFDLRFIEIVCMPSPAHPKC